jgi:hypothetical protein
MLQQLKLRRRLAAHKARAPSPDHSRGLSRANDQPIRHHSHILHRGQSGRRGRQGPRDQRGADRRDHSPCEQSIARCRWRKGASPCPPSCVEWWARGPHARIRAPAAFPTRTAPASLRAPAKQSIARQIRKMDCFVASAPRNDGTCIRVLAARFRAGFASIISPFANRGRGECRVPLRERVARGPTDAAGQDEALPIQPWRL